MIISEVKSHLLVAVKKSLEDMSYRTVILPASTNAINKFTEPIYGILLYADEQLFANEQALVYLKDRAIMDSIPLFVIGTPDEIKAIETIIPTDMVCLEFTRPISVFVNILAEKIDSAVRFYNRQKKILVVDDSGPMLLTVKSWLENKYSVYLANSAAMTIKYLALNRPDLILLDYAMPVVDGKQVLEMIRTETDFEDIPVIFLTNKGDKQSIMNVQDLKPDGYLLKSMEPEQIVKSVDEFFEQQKALM
jgi:CheY-like chemotaxis protein